MATPTLTPNSKKEQDERYDPSLLKEWERQAFDDIDENYNKSAGSSQENKNIDKARELTKDEEENPNVIPFTGSGGPGKPSRAKRIRGFFRDKKKSLPLAGVLGGTGIIGMLFALFGPMSMVISLTENLLTTNNGAQSAYERRITKVLGLKLADADGVCEVKRVKCKMGRMTTRGLKKLEKKGVVAFDADGNKLSGSSGRYPDKQIAKYTVDGIDDPIPAGQMKRRLADNPKIAAKLLGRSGAFNVRFQVWKGDYLKKNFYDRFGIKRDGGIADGDNKRSTKISQLVEKLKNKIPGIDGLDEDAKAKVRAKADKLIKRGKKGGVVYLTAVGGCIGVKAPGMVGSGVAAVQAARLLPIVSDVILSPGAKNKASLFTNISSEDVSAAGNLLTATDKNGKSALDSKYLQSAIGINKNKAGPSKDFSPGYGFLTNSVVKQARSAERKSEKECNAVLSPQAMYTALAVNTAVTVAASSTIIGGIIKVGAEWAASEAVAYVAVQAFEKFGTEIITNLAKNDELDKVLGGKPGEKLGDAVGISAMTFFSSGAAARHVPVLKQSQLITYNNIQKEQSEFQRNLDLASLSPFDVSSKYTFLGSMVNNMNMAIVANGSSADYFTSSLSYLASTPLKLLSPVTYAEDQSMSKNYCSYAEEFGMDTENDMTPAVNAAGLPCYGFVGNISTEDAIAIATGDNEADEKWVKDDIGDLGDEATLDEIVEKDSRLAIYLDGCGAGSIESGEWTDAAAGCTVDTNINSAINAGTGGEKICTGEEKPDVDNCFADTEGIGETVYKSSDAKESEAVAAFAIDYQISQAIDGNDDEAVSVSETSTDTSTTGELTVATYNITRTGVNGGTLPKTTQAAQVMNKRGASIIGVQEIDGGEQYRTFLAGLGDNFTGKVNETEGGGRAIFWDTTMFDFGKSGFYEIKKDGRQKQMVWVELKANGKSIYVFDMHADVGPDDVETRKNNARDTLRAIDEVVGTSGDPVILMGDMNSNYTDKPEVYNILKEKLNLTYDETTNRKNADCDTIREGARQECGRRPPASHGDHIYVSRDSGIVVNSWENITDGTGEISDHNPVIANLTVPGISSGEVAWPLDKKWWEANKSDWLSNHGSTGTAWGEDNMGTGGDKGAYIAADIGLPPAGSPVYAIVGGTVTSTSLCGENDGVAVKSIVNGKTLGIAYMHGDNQKVKKGDIIKAGDHIMNLGVIGCTVTGAHLHLGMAYDGKYFCPQDVFLALDKGTAVDWGALPRKALEGTCGR